ncbi:LPS biosynthesis like polysaccharide polymerase [Paucilactobacillus oligofermentans DSM 15707 = LMG 22743]|nr:EpsG family protein [Paucilactobacillus oligofermentans]CUS26957.1 LPS biosynthesis like polysaccharide polymerase [Paucilactobacillus oligofermentans DSM 15707 = LMG 22743]
MLNIYIYILIILVIVGILQYLLSLKKLVIIPVFLLTVVAGLRASNIGPDTINYVNDYNSILWGYGSYKHFELGYTWLEKIFSFFGAQVSVFLCFISLISLTIIASRYGKYTRYSVVAMLYYYVRFFLNRDMNQIRAALAAAILLFSIKYIGERRIIPTIGIILLASSIHSASLIALAVYPLYWIIWIKINSKKKILLIYLIAVFLLVPLSYAVAPYVETVFSGTEIGNTYITTSSGYVSDNGNGLLNPVILMQVIISVIGLSFVDIGEKRPYFKVLLSFYMLSTLILIFFNQYYVLAGRLSTMLATIEPLIVITVSEKITPKFISRASLIFLCILVFYLINISTGSIQNYYLPYSFMH